MSSYSVMSSSGSQKKQPGHRVNVISRFTMSPDVGHELVDKILFLVNKFLIPSLQKSRRGAEAPLPSLLGENLGHGSPEAALACFTRALCVHRGLP